MFSRFASQRKNVPPREAFRGVDDASGATPDTRVASHDVVTRPAQYARAISQA